MKPISCYVAFSNWLVAKAMVQLCMHSFQTSALIHCVVVAFDLLQVELALRVQLDYLESLVEDTSFNGPHSNLQKEIESYR